MPSSARGGLANDTELKAAGHAGLRGAIYGASLWGTPCLLALLIANQVHPATRRLTFQFKVFLQMSAMTAGSVIHADSALREYEKEARKYRLREARMRRDEEIDARFGTRSVPSGSATETETERASLEWRRREGHESSKGTESDRGG